MANVTTEVINVFLNRLLLKHPRTLEMIQRIQSRSKAVSLIQRFQQRNAKCIPSLKAQPQQSLRQA
ncbi:hypothetical protein T4E_1604 [Trichinella pseudospiralis]|uniref:Uncharacterized protein n=1 Tax=Trichinella pseudospiralis TaxID=6337 RepID=A0A0V0YBL0_TRIPS|nr:hypothetical protein T4E_1604 [Trichinella pseudospiralis]